MANQTFRYLEDELKDKEKTPDRSVSPRVSSEAASRGADPEIAAFMQEQAGLNDFRKAKLEADGMSNMSAALSQLALGTSAPHENPVYKNIATQNEELLGSKEKDLDRSRMVMNAIENRKAREAAAHSQHEDRELQRDQMIADKKLIRQDHQEKEARPSDKQTETINDFDQSSLKMEDALGKLGNHSDWLGPIDGRLPDALVDADQVKFRSAIGKFADQYRKAITGAGASNQEIARLESRLPTATDTFANFVAKAQGLIEEAKEGKGQYLKNLLAQGKNTKPFESMSPELNPSNQKQVAKKQYSPSRHQTKLIYSDGTEEILDGQQ